MACAKSSVQGVTTAFLTSAACYLQCQVIHLGSPRCDEFASQEHLSQAHWSLWDPHLHGLTSASLPLLPSTFLLLHPLFQDQRLPPCPWPWPAWTTQTVSLTGYGMKTKEMWARVSGVLRWQQRSLEPSTLWQVRPAEPGLRILPHGCPQNASLSIPAPSSCPGSLRDPAVTHPAFSPPVGVLWGAEHREPPRAATGAVREKRDSREHCEMVLGARAPARAWMTR